ncbi:MAG: universal stress protein [Jatrophihabitans sp.]|uniref:universal stress protein n=1 Tax=Jatrophihabitans sp. TaxID=1932789 RepID=UPI0039112421
MSAASAAPVVVGVSPRTGSPSALRWAADYALLRQAPMVAVMAWRPPRAPAAPGGRPPGSLLSGGLPDPEHEAAEQLEGYVTAALGKGHGVECKTVRGNEVSSLLEAGAEAQLLVLGEPRPGRMASVRTGLVAPQLVTGATCPVVVMPNSAGASLTQAIESTVERAKARAAAPE